jgi:hypothetical protein
MDPRHGGEEPHPIPLCAAEILHVRRTGGIASCNASGILLGQIRRTAWRWPPSRSLPPAASSLSSARIKSRGGRGASLPTWRHA